MEKYVSLFYWQVFEARVVFPGFPMQAMLTLSCI